MIINMVVFIYASCSVCAHCVNDTVAVSKTRITRNTFFFPRINFETAKCIPRAIFMDEV